MNSRSPSLIVLLNGKRKSGKDFLAELLHERYVNSNKCLVVPFVILIFNRNFDDSKYCIQADSPVFIGG